MFYKSSNRVFIYGLLLLVMCVYSQIVEANRVSKGNAITVHPNACISLHKGRKCFAKTNITWYAKTVGRYCISINAEVTHKKCWQDAIKGEFIYEMASKESVVITLYSANDNLELAKTIIEVSWLYTGDNRKRRWRLF